MGIENGKALGWWLVSPEGVLMWGFSDAFLVPRLLLQVLAHFSLGHMKSYSKQEAQLSVYS